MSIIRRAIKNLSLTDDKAWDRSLWNLFGARSNSGEVVNEHTALHYSAVYNAISLIAGTIGALPLHLMKNTGKSSEKATQKTLYSVLHSTPNPYMTAMNFRETILAHILAWGNGYAEIVRNGYGDVVELWPISPDRVRIEMIQGDMLYHVRVQNQEIILPKTKILHIPGLGFDGFLGYSVIAMARNSIGLGMALESFGNLYFSQGTHPGVIVSHPGKLSDSAHSNLKNSLSNAYSGLGRAHRLMLLEDGMKLEKIGIPPNDSQFLESRQYQIPEIARWFNIPPHKLKDLTKSSFSNIESEQISFVTDTLLPWGIRIEQNLNSQLLNVFERTQGYYFKHIFEGLLRGSSTTRAEFYSKLFNIGVMSINEIRDKEDMNPIEGGDIHMIPLNMSSIEDYEENYDDEETDLKEYRKKKEDDADDKNEDELNDAELIETAKKAYYRNKDLFFDGNNSGLLRRKVSR